MRIHLSLDPKHLAQPVAGPSSGPLVNIGGDLVLVELQGELNHEGDKADGVVGILGFDRPEKPTLHLGQHHLLHGKITNLAKPYAVIRRAVALTAEEGLNGEVEGDAEEEEDIEEDRPTPSKIKAKGKRKADEEEGEEEEPPLFPQEELFQTPKKRNGGSTNEGDPSSSPSTVYPSSVGRGTGYGYSSELDFSSPPIPDSSPNRGEEESEDEGEEERRRKRAKKNSNSRKERTRRYEVVGIVRKKVVFALRPEPIVTATILPE